LEHLHLFHPYKLPLHRFCKFHLSCLLIKHSPSDCDGLSFFIPSNYVFCLFILKDSCLVFAHEIISYVEFVLLNLLLNFVKRIIVWIFIEIELNRNFLLKFLFLFVSMLVNVNKLY
jgi:hypothetical protein